jgi:hypothetical protein
VSCILLVLALTRKAGLRKLQQNSRFFEKKVAHLGFAFLLPDLTHLFLMVYGGG